MQCAIGSEDRTIFPQSDPSTERSNYIVRSTEYSAEKPCNFSRRSSLGITSEAGRCLLWTIQKIDLTLLLFSVFCHSIGGV